MSYLKPNIFTAYAISEGDQLQGMCLTSIQKEVIQNDVASIAQQIISLSLDPYLPLKFTQEQSYLRGQLEYLQNMLIRSEEAEKLLIDMAAAQAAFNAAS